jgi:cytochrome c
MDALSRAQRRASRLKLPPWLTMRMLRLMDSTEVNKGMAAILVAGIAYFLSGWIGATLVHDTKPDHEVLKIEGAAPAEAAAEPAKVEPLPPIAPLLAKADAVAGEATTKKLCVSCHSFAEGGKAGVGPNLYGTVGAVRGHMEGFNYSAAFKAKPGAWSYDDLNAWLAKPAAFAPGTRMTFVGIKSAEQRADVIAYLRTLSKTPVPLP